MPVESYTRMTLPDSSEDTSRGASFARVIHGTSDRYWAIFSEPVLSSRSAVRTPHGSTRTSASSAGILRSIRFKKPSLEDEDPVHGLCQVHVVGDDDHGHSQ